MKRPLLATVLAASIGLPFLVIDTAGCGGALGENWTYGEAEMRAAVEGTWELTITDQGVAKKWTLAITQSDKVARADRETGLVKSAQACGSRSFVRNAHACASASTMPLEIAVLDGPEKTAVGKFFVGSTTFERGDLGIRIGKNPEDYRTVATSVSAGIDPTGKVIDLEAGRAGTDLKATLVRTKR